MKCFVANIVYLDSGELKTSTGIKWVAKDIFEALEKIKYGTYITSEIISITLTEERED